MDQSELLFLSKQDILDLDISLADTIELVESTFNEHGKNAVELPDKTSIHPKGRNGFFHSMPAMVENMDSVGIKWVSYFPGNKENDIPDASCVLMLNDTKTGLPICIMEGLYLTYLRTAAAAAVASKTLIRNDPKTIGIIGAGELSRWSLEALSMVHPTIQKAFVISRTHESRDLFCKEMKSKMNTIEFIPSDDLESVVRESDIVLSTTPQPDEPFLSIDWLKKGALGLPLDMIAAWKKDAYQKSDYIITDNASFLNELLEKKYGEMTVNCPVLEIGEVLANRIDFPSDAKIIAFMNGVGSIDVTLGKFVFERALIKGAGTRLSLY